MVSQNSQFLAACKRLPVDFTPVWFMRQSGRYLPEYQKLRRKFDVLTICKTPELSSFAALAPVKKLGVDAAIIFADLMLPVEAMGVKFRIVEAIGPVVDNPVANLADVKRLRLINPTKDTSFVQSAIKLVKNQLTRTPLIGFSGAPFTLACYLVEGGASRNFEKTKGLMYSNLKAWELLMTKLTKVVISYLEAQIEAGVDAIQLFDSWAGVLSEQDYQRYVAPYSQKIFSSIKKVPTIHFTTGNPSLLPSIAAAGGDVISVDWRISIGKAWKLIGDNRAIQGNLDPAVLFAPFKVVKVEVKKILVQTAGRVGYIFNLGHGIYPGTPYQNVVKLVEFVHKFG